MACGYRPGQVRCSHRGIGMRLRLLHRSFALFLSFTASAALADRREMVIYPAYDSQTESVIEGASLRRVICLTASRVTPLGQLSGAVCAAWSMTKKRARRSAIRIGSSNWTAVTDDEGYFRIAQDGPIGLTRGWHVVTADLARDHVEGRRAACVSLVRPAVRFQFQLCDRQRARLYRTRIQGL